MTTVLAAFGAAVVAAPLFVAVPPAFAAASDQSRNSVAERAFKVGPWRYYKSGHNLTAVRLSGSRVERHICMNQGSTYEAGGAASGVVAHKRGAGTIYRGFGWGNYPTDSGVALTYRKRGAKINYKIVSSQSGTTYKGKRISARRMKTIVGSSDLKWWQNCPTWDGP